MTLTEGFTDIDGCNIHYMQTGSASDGCETLVCLHGFPECWVSWKAQFEGLADDFRVVAPDLPGFNLSDKPYDPSFYQVTNLMAVMAGFIKKINYGKPVTLVAHDWGGAIAWPLTAFYPHLVRKLVILNAAHPSTFSREMVNSQEQRKKSAYIHKLVSDEGEQWASENDFARLRRMLFEGRLDHGFSEQEKQVYFEAWQQPGALRGMLNYYRNMPQLVAQDSDPEALDKIKIPQIRIEVPTLVLWGERDEAFANSVMDGLDKYVSQLTVKRFADASHWLQHEKAEQINDAIRQFAIQ